MMIFGIFVIESIIMLMGNIYGWKIIVNGFFRIYMYIMLVFNEGDIYIVLKL